MQEKESPRTREKLKIFAPKGPQQFSTWRAYGVGVLVVALCTALDWPIFPYVFPGNMVIVYLIGVLFVAVRYGIGPSIFVSLLSVMAFGLIYVPKYRNFAVPEVTYFYLLGAMLIFALLISGLTGGIRRKAETARLAHEVQQAQVQVETERMRNTFLSSISHDLRTPLATIKGAASSLLESQEALSPACKQELVRAIFNEANRLERQVKNLLDLTRLEAGAVHLRKEWHPFEEVVGAVLSYLESRLRGHPVRTEFPPDLPLVHLDGVLIQQVLTNLLENAVKYTPQESLVELSASAMDNAVLFKISDRGPGLKSGDEERIFEKFNRGGQIREGGVGLGLAICRGIIEAHGGRIWAENRPGGGASFCFTLPMEGNPPEVESEKTDRHDVSS
jgi:K+-sensing histidine kinase KdpD